MQWLWTRKPGTPRINVPNAAVAGLAPPALLAFVVDSADRLVETIDAATISTWVGARLANGTGATEVVWLALHDAIHQSAPLNAASTVVAAIPSRRSRVLLRPGLGSRTAMS